MMNEEILRQILHDLGRVTHLGFKGHLTTFRSGDEDQGIEVRVIRFDNSQFSNTAQSKEELHQLAEHLRTFTETQIKRQIREAQERQSKAMHELEHNKNRAVMLQEIL